VSADSEGNLKIWQTDNGEVRVCYCRLREIFLQILEQINNQNTTLFSIFPLIPFFPVISPLG
jgi:hypothetical protein